MTTMRMIFAAGLAAAVLAGGATAQSGPTSPAAAHGRLSAMVGGAGFYDGWAMHLPSPRTTDLKPGTAIRSESDCASVIATPEGEVRFDWRQVSGVRSSSSSRPIGSPMGERISLYFMESQFGASAPALRLFFRNAADRDTAFAAASYLAQRCNPGGFTVRT